MFRVLLRMFGFRWGDPHAYRHRPSIQFECFRIVAVFRADASDAVARLNGADTDGVLATSKTCDAPSRNVLLTLRQHMLNLESRYPGTIAVAYEE